MPDLSTSETLRAAAARLRELAERATPGPWRWGDWSTEFGSREEDRRTLEHAPGRGPFPAVVNRDDQARLVLPTLQDSIEIGGYDNEDLDANARWIAMMSPTAAESLAAWLDSTAAHVTMLDGDGDCSICRPAVAFARAILASQP